MATSGRTSDDASAAARRRADAARHRGDRFLVEAEALEIAAAIGIGAPEHLILPDAAAAGALETTALAGRRVVVKMLDAGVTHKTDVGGVRTVPNDPAAIAAAIDTMPPARAGYLVQEWVGHDPGPAREVLLAARWTAEHGALVTLAPGGSYAELLAGPGSTTTLAPVFSPSILTAAIESSRLLRLLVHGFRATPPATTQSDLVDLITRMLEFAQTVMPHDLTAFEVNPLVFTEAGPVALDAVAEVGTGAAPDPAPSRPPGKLESLLHPGSIAIVGVSDRMNPGRIILENVLDSGFPKDKITVVKAGRDEVAGCTCVPAIADLPGPVDLLVLSIAASQVPAAIDEAITAGAAESIVLIPGGLGEKEGTEEAAAGVAAAIRAARSQGGPVVNGGNCLGVRSEPGRYDTFFIPRYKLPRTAGEVAPVAVVSQSGALTLSRLGRLPWLRPRYVVSLGNQIDLTAGDYLAHFAADPKVEVAAFYLESFRPGDGLHWLEQVSRMRARGGAVILYRAGRTREGAGAAATHTAAIAGDYETTASLAQTAGALVADSMEDWEDLLMLSVMLRARGVAGTRVGAVSNAGFESVAIADNLGPLWTEPFTEATAARIEAILERTGVGSIVAARNPLDLTPIADDATFAEAADAVLGDANVDVGIVGCVPYTPALRTLAPSAAHAEDVAAGDAIASLLIRTHRDGQKAWVAVVDGGREYEPFGALLTGAGIPVFRSADRAARLLGRYCRWRIETLTS